MNRIIKLLACVSLTLNSYLLTLNSQSLPQGYFRLPVDGDIGLSATFAEIRPNHLHAGLDIRTGRATGKPVYAVADGYVCGVRISPWGGGKMLYVKHSNGYTRWDAMWSASNTRSEATAWCAMCRRGC